MSKKKHHSKLSQAIGNIGSKQRNKAAAALKKVGQKLKHPFEVILDLAIAPGKLAAFLPLAPLAGTMQAYLKKKGVKVPGSKLDYPENLARQFYQVAVLKGKPLTKGVGLADRTSSLEHMAFLSNVHKHYAKSVAHLEHVDDDTDTVADQLVDKGADAVSKAGLVGSVAGAAIKIIHGIINFIRGMKKKHNAAVTGVPVTVATSANKDKVDEDKSTVLTPEEKAAVGDHPLDSAIVTNADKAQDIMADAGIGNVNSKSEAVVNGKVIKLTPTGEIDDYGTGLIGAIRRAFHHHPKHTEILAAHLEHLIHSEDTNSNEVKTSELKSTKIDSSNVSNDGDKKPVGGIFERLFSSIKHKLHIDSLEHAEGKCEGHGCKPKRNHHKR